MYLFEKRNNFISFFCFIFLSYSYPATPTPEEYFDILDHDSFELFWVLKKHLKLE